MSKSHPFCRVPIQADDYLCECEKEGEKETLQERADRTNPYILRKENESE